MVVVEILVSGGSIVVVWDIVVTLIAVAVAVVVVVL